jgi:hypothetical protein
VDCDGAMCSANHAMPASTPWPVLPLVALKCVKYKTLREWRVYIASDWVDELPGGANDISLLHFEAFNVVNTCAGGLSAEAVT